MGCPLSFAARPSGRSLNGGPTQLIVPRIRS